MKGKLFKKAAVSETIVWPRISAVLWRSRNLFKNNCLGSRGKKYPASDQSGCCKGSGIGLRPVRSRFKSGQLWSFLVELGPVVICQPCLLHRGVVKTTGGEEWRTPPQGPRRKGSIEKREKVNVQNPHDLRWHYLVMDSRCRLYLFIL